MLRVTNLVGFGGGKKPSIRFVGSKTIDLAGATSGTTTIDCSTGLTGGIGTTAAIGDVIIGVFATGSDRNRTLSIVDGDATAYTLIDSELHTNSTIDANLRVAYNTVSNANDLDAVFGNIGDADDSGALAVYVFRGVGAVGSVNTTINNATAIVNPPSVTPTVSGSFIVAVGACGHSRNIASLSNSELTGFVQQNSLGTFDCNMGIGHKPDWTSGAFDPVAFTWSEVDSTNYSYAAMTFVLEPA